jgi:hypothetical protein
MKFGFLFLSTVSAFLNPLSTHPHKTFFPFLDNIVAPCHAVVDTPIHKTNLLDNFMDIEHQLQVIKEQSGFFVVKAISSGLPYVDNIGHRVLHANDVFISQIINADIPHELKESIILSSIKLSMLGDQFGGHLLHMYYVIVEKSF